MPLRIINRERTYPREILGTTFRFRSLTVGEKEELLHRIENISKAKALSDLPDDERADTMAESLYKLLCDAIASIDGFDMKPIDVLRQLENFSDLQSIVQCTLLYCSLDPEEIKNSDSSSVQPTPGSAGSAEIRA